MPRTITDTGRFVVRCEMHDLQWEILQDKVSLYYSKVRPVQLVFDRPVVPAGLTSKGRCKNSGLRASTCERRQERLVSANDAGGHKP